MTDRSEELKAAAEAIHPAALDEAKAAIATSCREYLRWAGLFSLRLQSLPDGELHRFARAFSLTLLGHLPTRPGTCPFCIQYGKDRSCSGCGYAATHGRCDEDDSAFSVFIEAFQELGRAIYQDTGRMCFSADEARHILPSCIQSSIEAVLQMEQALASASTLDLMQLKAKHMGKMVDLIPVQLLSQEVAIRRQKVKSALRNYW